MTHTKIKVIDSIMGSGKSSWAIQKMNEDVSGNYIYITPFLSEVQRIKEECISRRFVEPKNFGSGKLYSFNNLLKNGKNIASTHSLFKMADDDTKELIRANDYTLILDEVMDVITQIKLETGDLKLMLNEELIIIHENGIVEWNSEKTDYNSRYNDIKNMCKNNSVFMVNNCLLMWTFPIEVFKSFKEVYILTYLFNGQVQKYYYDIYNIQYEYMSVVFDNNARKYVLCDYIKDNDLSKIKKLIHIIDNGDKINRIGDNKYSLSKTWFEKKEILYPTLVKNIENFFKNKCKSKSIDNMWTTFKDYKCNISGNGYTKGFISLGTRATNDYVNKVNLAYCANIFLNPMIEQFFRNNDISVNEDVYALSELIQWIWRSQIRRGDEINLYIPSLRMRNLLLEWLG